MDSYKIVLCFDHQLRCHRDAEGFHTSEDYFPKVESIKAMRDVFDMGLKEAKELVEKLMTGECHAVPNVYSSVEMIVTSDQLCRLQYMNRRIGHEADPSVEIRLPELMWAYTVERYEDSGVLDMRKKF